MTLTRRRFVSRLPLVRRHFGLVHGLLCPVCLRASPVCSKFGLACGLLCGWFCWANTLASLTLCLVRGLRHQSLTPHTMPRSRSASRGLQGCGVQFTAVSGARVLVLLTTRLAHILLCSRFACKTAQARPQLVSPQFAPSVYLKRTPCRWRFLPGPCFGYKTQGLFGRYGILFTCFSARKQLAV